MTDTAPLRIDHPGFNTLFEQVAQVGRTPAGGLHRLAASAAGALTSGPGASCSHSYPRRGAHEVDSAIRRGWAPEPAQAGRGPRPA